MGNKIAWLVVISLVCSPVVSIGAFASVAEKQAAPDTTPFNQQQQNTAAQLIVIRPLQLCRQRQATCICLSSNQSKCLLLVCLDWGTRSWLVVA